jgi:hypothetical protein
MPGVVAGSQICGECQKLKRAVYADVLKNGIGYVVYAVDYNKGQTLWLFSTGLEYY